jgi:hypothetical protein
MGGQLYIDLWKGWLNYGFDTCSTYLYEQYKDDKKLFCASEYFSKNSNKPKKSLNLKSIKWQVIKLSFRHHHQK